MNRRTFLQASAAVAALAVLPVAMAEPHRVAIFIPREVFSDMHPQGEQTVWKTMLALRDERVAFDRQYEGWGPHEEVRCDMYVTASHLGTGEYHPTTGDLWIDHHNVFHFYGGDRWYDFGAVA